MRKVLGGVLMAAAVVVAAPVRAHHSFAVYDAEKTLVFTGVVTRVNPDANHLQIFFAPMNAEHKNVERGAGGHRGYLGELVPARHDLQRGAASAAQRRAGRQQARHGRDLQVPGEDTAAGRQALRHGRGAPGARSRRAAAETELNRSG